MLLVLISTMLYSAKSNPLFSNYLHLPPYSCPLTSVFSKTSCVLPIETNWHICPESNKLSSLLRLFPFPDLKRLFRVHFVKNKRPGKVIGYDQIIEGKTPAWVHYTTRVLESQIKLILVSAQPQICAWASRRPEEPCWVCSWGGEETRNLDLALLTAVLEILKEFLSPPTPPLPPAASWLNESSLYLPLCGEPQAKEWWGDPSPGQL